MRQYGLVLSRFWLNHDLKAANQAAPHARELACYLVSSPHCNGIGCYPLPLGYVTSDLGYRFETVSKGLGELFRVGFSAYCERTEYVLVRRFLRWNPLANANVAKARAQEFEGVPSEFAHLVDLAGDLLEFGAHFSDDFNARLERFANGSETVSKPLPEPFRNPDPDPDPLPEPKDPRVSELPFDSPAPAPAREGRGLSPEQLEIAEAMNRDLEQRRAALSVVGTSPARHVTAGAAGAAETRKLGNSED